MTIETLENQQKDSDMIFTQITNGDFDNSNYTQAVMMLYAMDRSISRCGISHALKRLETHYGVNQ